LNTEEIKNRVEAFKRDWEASKQCCDVEDFSDEVLFLLTFTKQLTNNSTRIFSDYTLMQSKLEQAEKALEYYVNMSIKPQEGQLITDWLRESTYPAIEALQRIRGN
jgi:hypothetical protein